MQEKGSLQLFEDLHTLLQDFVRNYMADHTNPLAIETQCLNKLRSIAGELAGFLKDKSSPEKFTFDKYETFILRIESIKPPQEITKTQKSTGFLGIIGASESSEKVTVGLYNAMNRLITNLTAKAAEAKAKVEKTSEKTPPLEEKKVSSEIELFKQQLATFDQRLIASEQRAFEEGKKAGQVEIIQYIKGNIGRYMNAQQQKQVLLLLDAKSSEATSSTSSTSSAVPVMFATVSDIKDDNQEVKEAREYIGNAKFEPIKKLVTCYNLGQASEQEKIVAKWLIFELMLSKYNQTISSIFEGVKLQLSTQCSLNVADLPNLNSLFEAHSQSHDAVTTQVLSAEELAKFHKLTSRTAIYLPQDGTASNCFGSQAARLQGKSVPVVTKEDYVKNAVTKLNGLVKSASVNINM